MSKEVELTCPVCKAVKIINIPEAIFTQKKFGTLKLQVPAEGVCSEHQFIAFVDTKGIVRGYEKIDIHMTAPAGEIKEQYEKMEELSLNLLFQMFGLHGVFSLLHAKLFNYPSYIMNPENTEDITDKLNEFFDKYIPEKYRGTSLIKSVNEEDYFSKSRTVQAPRNIGTFSYGGSLIDYGKIKIKEKNALFIDAYKTILQTPWSEKLKFEEAIFKKALEIIDPREQVILISQDINKFIKETEQVVSNLENAKEIYEDDLIDILSKYLNNPKINHYRLSIIKDFIKQRVSSKLTAKIKNKVEDFLNLL